MSTPIYFATNIKLVYLQKLTQKPNKNSGHTAQYNTKALNKCLALELLIYTQTNHNVGDYFKPFEVNTSIGFNVVQYFESGMLCISNRKDQEIDLL